LYDAAPSPPGRDAADGGICEGCCVLDDGYVWTVCLIGWLCPSSWPLHGTCLRSPPFSVFFCVSKVLARISPVLSTKPHAVRGRGIFCIARRQKAVGACAVAHSGGRETSAVRWKRRFGARPPASLVVGPSRRRTRADKVRASTGSSFSSRHAVLAGATAPTTARRNPAGAQSVSQVRLENHGQRSCMSGAGRILQNRRHRGPGCVEQVDGTGYHQDERARQRQRHHTCTTGARSLAISWDTRENCPATWPAVSMLTAAAMRWNGWSR